MDALNVLLILLMAGVVMSLFCGVFFMLRGGQENSRRSNKMMIFRVLFQACALALLGVMFLVGR